MRIKDARPSALSEKQPQRFRARHSACCGSPRVRHATRLPSHLRRTRCRKRCSFDMTKGLAIGGPEADARRVQCRGSYHDSGRCALQSQEVATREARPWQRSDLYGEDIQLWSKRQSELLRRLAAGERVTDQVDWPNVVGEIADVGQGNAQPPTADLGITELRQQLARAEAPSLSCVSRSMTLLAKLGDRTRRGARLSGRRAPFGGLLRGSGSLGTDWVTLRGRISGVALDATITNMRCVRRLMAQRK